MHSVTISMPALTVSESSNTRKKQVRLFACINNQIDLKIMNSTIIVWRCSFIPGTENSIP